LEAVVSKEQCDPSDPEDEADKRRRFARDGDAAER